MATHQAPLSLGFPRQEYWSGLPLPSPMYACIPSHFSRVQLCVILWTAAHQAPLSMGFSWQESWSGLPFPSPMHACMLSHFSGIRLCVILWTAAHQAPPSTGFSRQEYWSGLPFPSPSSPINSRSLKYFLLSGIFVKFRYYMKSLATQFSFPTFCITWP